MIGLKLLSTLFIAFCVFSVIQASDAEEALGDSKQDSWSSHDDEISDTAPSAAVEQNPEAPIKIPSKALQPDLQTLISPFKDALNPSENSPHNDEIPSEEAKNGQHNCAKRDAKLSMPPNEVIHQGLEAVISVAEREATLNPASLFHQYDSFSILLKVIQQNFKSNLMNSSIVDNFLKSMLITNAHMKKEVDESASDIKMCQTSHYNRTIPDLHKFFLYNNTPCDLLVDHFQQKIEQTIQAVEKVRNQLQPCVESESFDTSSESTVVSAAFLVDEFKSSIEQLLQQQYEVFTSMKCCTSLRVEKIQRKFISSLTSYQQCVRKSHPSFNISGVPVVNNPPECEERFLSVLKQY